MTRKPTDAERAEWAHRTAFALITEALSSPGEVDPGERVREYTAEQPDRDTAMHDLAHVLVWHAAGAILRAAGGDTEQALRIVREGALQQETTKEEPNE